MFIKSLISHNGNACPNQVAIELNDGTVFFQSYKSICAMVKNGKLTLGSDWCYSKTTSRWLRVFLDEYAYKYSRYTKAEIQKALKSGEIKLNPDLKMVI